MGTELATHLVRSGWNVACADINKHAEKIAGKLGPAAEFFETNVADYNSQASMFQAVWNKWGRIDVLCANAGVVDRSSVYILKHKNSKKSVPTYLLQN